MEKIDTFYMSDEQIEQMKRKKNWNKKMAKSGALILSAIASFLIGAYVPPVLTASGIQPVMIKALETICAGIYTVGSIVGVCSFAKALHDPLTPQEIEELKAKDAIEKGGMSR